MTRRTLFASLIGAPVAAAWNEIRPRPILSPDIEKLRRLVLATSAMLDEAPQISTYWEGERLPLLFGADGQILSASTRTGSTVIRVA